MDLSRDIIYRGFTLNDSAIASSIVGGGAAGSGIAGCQLDTADLSDVDVVQYIEKRSLADGMDAGDVFFGARRIRLAGTLYAKTRLTLFDSLWDLRAALNPVLAQRESPADKGYQPFYFSVPTNRASDYPSGVIELQVKALPRAFQALYAREHNGGSDDDALAIPWQATLLCRDPGIYSADPIEVDFTATSTVTGTGQNTGDTITKNGHGLVNGDRVTFSTLTGGAGLSTGVTYYVVNKATNTFQVSLTLSGAAVPLTGDYSTVVYVKSSTAAGNWGNRGNYLGTFNMLVEVGAGAGSISVTVGDSAFTITVPASTVNRIIRVKGTDKVLTVEENSVEQPRLSYVSFQNDTTWPLIDPGSTPYSVTFHGMSGVVAGSRMWFYEQYA